MQPQVGADGRPGRLVSGPAPLLTQPLERGQEHVDPLVGIELAEEAERGVRRLTLDLGRRPGAPPVVLEQDPLARDAPLDEPLEQHGAGGDEQVDEPELRLDEAPAQEEALRGRVGKALVASPRRLVIAEGMVHGPDHLALVVADREELVQRVDDRHAGQRPPDLADGVIAQEERVLEVDDVGADGEQELAEVLGVEALVEAHRSVEPVEVVAIGIDEVLVVRAVDGGEPGLGMRPGAPRLGRSAAGEEDRVPLARVSEGEMQFVGVGLGSSGPDLRVVVGDEEDPSRVPHGVVSLSS